MADSGNEIQAISIGILKLKSTKKTIIIRTDACPEIGTGHLFRCLRLARVLARFERHVVFVTSDTASAILKLIVKEGFDVICLKQKCISQKNSIAMQLADARGVLQIVQDYNIEWIIKDLYHLEDAWLKMLQAPDWKLMVIDDFNIESCSCDLLLNQNYQGTGNRIQHYNLASLNLVGPEYALLDESYSKIRQSSKISRSKMQRLNVYFGGSDSDNLTETVIEAIAASKHRSLEIDIVIGSTNQSCEKIKTLCHFHKFNFYVQVPDYSALLNQADVAIGATGSTTWERLCLGIPSLLVCVAENQLAATEKLNADHLIIQLENSHKTIGRQLVFHLDRAQNDYESFAELGRRGMEIVDGLGAERVALAITEFSGN